MERTDSFEMVKKVVRDRFFILTRLSIEAVKANSWGGQFLGWATALSHAG